MASKQKVPSWHFLENSLITNLGECICAMTYNDNSCTLRLRVHEPKQEPACDSTECFLQQEVSGGWIERGKFEFLELAIRRAKDASVLLYERGVKNYRQLYRLICAETLEAFAYFDVLDGVLYPGTWQPDRKP